MDIPVEQNNEFLTIKIEDVLFIRSYKHKIELETFNGTYHVLNTLQDFYNLLAPGFERVDKSAVVNLKNITAFDPIKNVVLFESGGVTKTCFVSRRNAKKLEQLLI